VWLAVSELPVTEWHAVQVVTVPVQPGVVTVPPADPPLRVIAAPWHHVEAHFPAVVPDRGVHVPFWRFALAAPVKTTSFVPFEWPIAYVATFAWHVRQVKAFA
jgi:hypothetical protein